MHFVNHAGSRYMLLVLIALLAIPFTAAAEQESSHPLQVHMNQWLQGSREWRTPNPNYRPPETAGQEDKGYPEFAVYWEWDEHRKFMQGELTGVRGDGSKIRFWTLFAFYNPVTERVLYLQIGRNGAMIRAEDPVRKSGIEFGELEVLEAFQYSPDGDIKFTRHENVFHENGTHTSNVYERNENGSWQLVNTWTWTLTNREP